MKGHVSPISEGVWRIWIENGRDPLTHRRRRVTKTFKGTKKQAEEHAQKMVIEVREGDHSIAAATVGQLLDRWLEHAEPNLAALTIRMHRSRVETHIRPALGDLPLRKLTTAKLDAFYRELHKRGHQRTGKGLSAQTVHHVHSILHRAFEQARRWGWVDRNPAEFAEPPKVHKRDHDLPPITEILAVASRLTVDMRELVWLAIVTGARRGELCALRWCDVDLERGYITFVHSLIEHPHGLPTLKATKTDNERRVTLDATTAQMLGDRRHGQQEKAQTCGVTFPRTAFVFGDDPTGLVALRGALVTKRWANAARVAGVKCRFHDLRHFAVTELLDAGFEVGGVSKRVGHSSIVMTHNRYQHVRGTSDLAASEHLAALLNPR